MNDNEIRIVNYEQAYKYIQNGVQPIRLETTDRIIFVFLKSDTWELFRKWRNREL